MDDRFGLSEVFELVLRTEYRTAPAEATAVQVHSALAKAVMAQLSDDWSASVRRSAGRRRAYYFSAEFLVGRAIANNLLCLGLTEEAEAILEGCGMTLSGLEGLEDAGLGNGGLGRLAACFLDSAATLRLPLDGYGIRYRYGLFRQEIVDGFQRERVDDWTKYGDPWSVRAEEDAVTVRFADAEVRAVPYDMPVVGYRSGQCSTLRLWQAEPLEPFDLELFNEQRYAEAVRQKTFAEDISRVLYPNDTTREGKLLRLRQQYFFCSASLQDLLRRHKAAHGGRADDLAEYAAIQLNDTHPAIAIPELLRLLIDGEGMGFEQAFAVAGGVFCYTNHTILPEALERWDADLMQAALPRIVELIAETDRRLERELAQKGVDGEAAGRMAILRDGVIHMAHLAIYCSRAVNGVAKLHSELLSRRLFADWSAVWPERFSNKTNGVTQRRWLALANPELSALLTELLGDDGWTTDLSRLRQLDALAGDPAVMERFLAVKQKKHRDLAGYLARRNGISIDPDTMFDVQIKRLHEYKRQLLNILTVLELYFEHREGALHGFTPTTVLFGAKAAPGYRRAKGIIKLIGEVSRLIDADESARRLLKVVFVPNYGVSAAERIIAAADVSQQISTAGAEASGTGNMKLMMNGAVTFGTCDGANIEIVAEAGEENNYIFGATVPQLAKQIGQYDPTALYQSDRRIRRVLDALVDGTLDDGGTGMFAELYDSLLKGASWHRPDQYAVLLDFDSCLAARKRLSDDYKDRTAFATRCWHNICRSGYFSSDRTVSEYAREIWRIEPVR